MCWEWLNNNTIFCILHRDVGRTSRCVWIVSSGSVRRFNCAFPMHEAYFHIGERHRRHLRGPGDPLSAPRVHASAARRCASHTHTHTHIADTHSQRGMAAINGAAGMSTTNNVVYLTCVAQAKVQWGRHSLHAGSFMSSLSVFSLLRHQLTGGGPDEWSNQSEAAWFCEPITALMAIF